VSVEFGLAGIFREDVSATRDEKQILRCAKDDSKKGKSWFVLRNECGPGLRGETWGTRSGFGETCFVIPTLRKMREGWGTRQVF
jgi:hypothetical protein